MNRFRTLAPDVFVAGQITGADLVVAKGRGVVRVINNRPDGEEPNQPTAFELETAARELGLEYVHAPTRGMPGPDVIATVQAALLDGAPVLLYCKSGMRSAAAWALASSRSGALSRDEILTGAAAAGYDLGGLPL
ncbi:MAG TPA: TIGR01244 family sulfur transferase [Brevundimonas sp.]|jgi:uncharacterized protein (TIGR01244 family)